MHAKMTEVSLEQNGDYVIYIGLGALSSQLPGGKQWIKLDVSKLGKSAGVDLGNLMSGSQLSPTDLLGVLKSEGAKVQKLGTAKVGGTTTTHYRVRVDVAKALKAKGLTSPLLGSVAPKMKTLSEDVWIGKDGLVHRIGLATAVAGRRTSPGDDDESLRLRRPRDDRCTPEQRRVRRDAVRPEGLGSRFLH